MAESFKDLGLRSELVEAVRARGWEAPSSLQRATIPVVRRGGNAVIRGSAGAGVLGAYGLPLLDRLSEEVPKDAPLCALVMTPTREVAGAVAASMAPLADAVGLRVHALAPGWPAETGDAAILVATPRAALDAMGASRLKLESLLAVVLDGATALYQLGGGPALETVTDAVPRDAQRVVVGDPEGAVADFVERHVRRALTFPSVPADSEAHAPTGVGRVGYLVAADAKLDALVPLLEQAAVDVVCRTDARAQWLARLLAHRGLGGRQVAGPDGVEGKGPVISFDVPFDGDELAQRHQDGGAVIVHAREIAHLRRIAAAAGVTLEAVAVPPPRGLVQEVDAYRDHLLQAVHSQDLGAQMMVLEPLLAQASMAELAAAASALARQRGAAAPRQPAARRPEPESSAKAPRPGEPFMRLFLSIGERDEVGPGDILGAITGESGIDGAQVGRIDIGDTFTTVEVESAVAQRVIDALNGTTLRSRSLRVDYDRKGGRGGGARSGGHGGRRPAPRSGPRGRS
ncbi:MAG TPA: DEAD/DEAH box helicase [Longimicrobiales bacterium]|nr:DEAD/DEAH box helicase [Longimicrobiales bacterium]